VVAANALLPAPLTPQQLYPHAVSGEAVASGARHGDNVGPMLLGGLVLAGAERLLRVPVPTGLHCAVVHPHCVLETRAARAVLAAPYALHDFVVQSAHLALLLAACYRGEIELLREGLHDVLVEPRRAALVPGFASVRAALRDAGALGGSLSGAGPSSVRLVPRCRLGAHGAGGHARRLRRPRHRQRGLGGTGRRPLRGGCRMRFLSTRGAAPAADLVHALAVGLAPDGGLYLPATLPRIDLATLAAAPTPTAVCAELLRPFFADSPLATDLPALCGEAYAQVLPLRALAATDDYVLELFHGPTAAFKDIGARFLAAALQRLRAPGTPPLTILVATSGDTGAAVAAAFITATAFAW